MYATNPRLKRANLEVEAERGQSITRTHDQHKQIDQRQVEEETEREMLEHLSLAEHDYIQNVATQTDADYENEQEC